jgi:hypothetical protein
MFDTAYNICMAADGDERRGDGAPYDEVCEGCGEVAQGLEFRTGDESAPTARWTSMPPGWLSATDAGGERVVCSLLCARRVDAAQRAQDVTGRSVPPRLAGRAK